MTPYEFRALRAGKVCDYFPDPANSHASSASQGFTDKLAFDDQVLRRFNDDFNRLLAHRKGMQGLAKARQFQLWWEQNRAAYLTRPVIENYRESGLSLGEFLDDLHLHFIASQARARQSTRVARAFNRLPLLDRLPHLKMMLPIILSLVFVGHKLFSFLVSLLLLGPGVQMVNSYTNPVVTPLAETAKQIGSRDLAPVASTVQSWLTHRSQLKEVRREIHETTDKLKKIDFKVMSPEQIQAKWQDFEKTYFDLFLRYNQTLPAHLRDGRGYFRDWMVFTQVALASNLATFDIQYWMHRREMERASDPRLRERHGAEARAAESRIAGTLAAWKLYEFMYPEFNHDPFNLKARGELKNTYREFVKTMRFDVYVDQFVIRMREVLKNMDADFLMQDSIATAFRPN